MWFYSNLGQDMCVKQSVGGGREKPDMKTLTAHVCNNKTPWLATTEDIRISPCMQFESLDFIRAKDMDIN